MNTQHTPGPWTMREFKDGTRHIKIEGSIASIADGYITAANARLIAAAPELLEALQYIAGHAQACLLANEYGKQEGLKDCVKAAMEAIAKAEGR